MELSCCGVVAFSERCAYTGYKRAFMCGAEDDLRFLLNEFRGAKFFFTNGTKDIKVTMPNGELMPYGKVQARMHRGHGQSPPFGHARAELLRL